ncbi:homoserine dehydrogenase [Longivirga aurantiaca]|uniref:Homoserine dehydrogenase n=1 Tax=Longivirga aurantiaca TaxID=1837743 RepID=A0ABW1T0L3_9ACTN
MTTPDAPPRELTVALLGGGTVGSQVARLLRESADDLAARAGAALRLTGVGVRDAAKPREGIAPELLTDDLEGLASSGADIVVEVMGGIEPARSLILAAMAAGSSVVTANKALLAEDGGTLHAAAEKHGVDLYYEASVAGAIPLLRPLRESLAGDKVRRVLGIVNGTTNFILTKMDEDGADYADVLAEAQALGYAEADPTADVEGYDAAAKAAILAGLAFHTRVRGDDVHREGITSVSAQDVAAARDMGFVIKLLAVAELVDDEKGVVVRVHPAMVPRTHPLAGVRGAFNAVFVEAESAGDMMFYGRGAGGAPTASAVLGDIVAVARHRLAGSRGPGESTYAHLDVLPIGDATTRYYVNLDVADRPGVLAAVAQAFADNGVSIQNVRQDGHGDDARLVVRTHTAADSALAATIERLRSNDAVRNVVGVMRVEGEDER